jgi:alkyl hydroperoxide reductase subunit F
MLDDSTKAQLKSYLERATQPIEIVASLDDSKASGEMLSLLKDVAEASPLVKLTESRDDNHRKPSFSVNRPSENHGPRFAGLPMGHEFTSLILALLQIGGYPPKVEDAVLEQIRALDGDFEFEIYVSLTCHNCPDVVQALNLMAIQNPRIRTTMIEGGTFQDEVKERQVMAVPTVFLNGTEFGQGRMSLEEILAKIDTSGVEREARKIAAKDPFDVLIVGGGPAGAAAAVYAARKGIRTGVASERFGGQVLDTLGIENFISIKETEGPKFAHALEEHVRDYDVDIMNLQRAKALVPNAGPGKDLIEVQLESGASLKSKSIIISTGARWRNINVPGEHEFKNKGVAYCPHCDGPLFKGKRVAVIGGGNSGVEAAIDLAGIVGHVTLIEFDTAAARRRRAAAQAQEPEERRRVHQRADHRDHRRPEGQRPGLQGPRNGRAEEGRTRRRVHPDRPGAQHGLAQGRGRADEARRNRGRRQGADLGAGRVRGGRRDDRAVQADHHRRR